MIDPCREKFKIVVFREFMPQSSWGRKTVWVELPLEYKGNEGRSTLWM